MGKKSNRKGRKNLTRLESGGVVNQHNVQISAADLKRFRSEVTKANRKRKKLLEENAPLPRKFAGKNTGDTLNSLQLMGRESDFILAKKSASLQRFKTRKEFDNYLANLERVNNPNYVTERIRDYKRNFTRSLQETYGWDAAKDIIMKVRTMKPEQYMRLVESDETLEISFVPSDVKVEGRLNQLRAALGMKLKDEWPEEYYEE